MDFLGDLGIAAAAVAITSMVLKFIAGNKILWLVTALPLALWALNAAPVKFKFSSRMRMGIMAAVVLYFLWAMALFTIQEIRGPAAATARNPRSENMTPSVPVEPPREDRIGGG